MNILLDKLEFWKLGTWVQLSDPRGVMSSRLKTKIFIIVLYHKSGSLADLPGEFVEGQVLTVNLKNLLSIWAFSLP